MSEPLGRSGRSFNLANLCFAHLTKELLERQEEKNHYRSFFLLFGCVCICVSRKNNRSKLKSRAGNRSTELPNMDKEKSLLRSGARFVDSTRYPQDMRAIQSKCECTGMCSLYQNADSSSAAIIFEKSNRPKSKRARDQTIERKRSVKDRNKTTADRSKNRGRKTTRCGYNDGEEKNEKSR